MDINRIFYNINFNNLDDLKKNINDLILRSNQNIRKLEKNISYIDFINTISDDITLSSNIHSLINLITNVSKNKKIINICYIYLKILNDNEKKIYSNKIIYKKIVQILNNENISNTQRFFLDKIVYQYKLDGIEFNKEEKKNFDEIKNKISKLESDIKNHIQNDESRIIGLTKENTERIFDNEFIDTLPIISNKPIRYGIILNDNNYNLLISNIVNHNLRNKIENIYNNKCCKSTHKIVQLFVERYKLSKMLSFNNFMDYKLKKQSEDNKNKIEHILLTIYDKINVLYDKEYNMLLDLKKKHCKRKNIKFEKKINNSDINYFLNKWKKIYGINDKEISEYFPLNKVFQNIMKIYEKFFNIKFKKIVIKDLWDKDVMVYLICDKTHNLLGTILFDLYFRENKSNNIKFYELKTGCIYPLNKNIKQYPVSCLVSNFTKNRGDNILLNISDVLILFSEFGNIIQQIYSFNKYSLLSGLSSKNDYNKIIPNIFQNIFWNEDIIIELSNHFINEKKINSNLTKKIINSRNMNNGIFYKYQLMLSIFDIIIHTSEKLNNHFINYNNITGKDKNIKCNNLMYTIFKRLHTQFFSLTDNKIDIQNNNYFPSLWNHMLSNNSSLYYSYIWNEIIASEIYKKKIKKEDCYNFDDKFINFLINYNNIKPAENIKVYLGEIPSIESFCKLKNIILEEENSIYFTPKTNINSTTNNYINTAKIINTKKKCFTISEDENYSDSSDDLDKSFNEFNTINNFSENVINENYNDYNTNIIETETELASENYNSHNTDNSQSLNKNIFVKNI